MPRKSISWSIISMAICSLCQGAANAQTPDEVSEFTRCLREPVDKLPIRDVSTVLQELAGLRERYRHGEEVKFPRAILHLHSGKELSGFVVKMGLFDQKSMVTFCVLPENDRFPDPELAYVPVSEIDAVAILQIDQVERYISFVDPSLIDHSAPPTRLEIKRKVSRFGAILSQAFGTPITVVVDFTGFPESPDSLKSLAKLMSDSVGELVTLSENDFSKGEVAKKVKNVSFCGSNHLVIRQDKGTLSIGGPVDEKAPAYDRAQLKLSLQKAL